MGNIKGKWQVMKTALVTGGAGFIGSNLSEYLLNHNYKVICVDDLSAGHMSNISSMLENKNFIFVNRDITIDNWHKWVWNGHDDKRCIPNLFEEYNIDTIFHNAAAKKVVCLKAPLRDLEINARATLRLLELASEYDVKKFVHASTGSVYGERAVIPQTEDHPLNPLSFYGASKLLGEKYVDIFNKEGKLNTVVLRYFHVFGQRQDWRYDLNERLGYVIPIFIDRIYHNKVVYIHGDGNQERSFTYIDDVVGINNFVANNNKCKGKIFNCASGLKITINELYDEICNIIGNRPGVIYDYPTFGDPRHFDVSHKALELQGYRFKTNFYRDIETTVNWYIKRCKSIN